jgi:hypothetical protein
MAGFCGPGTAAAETTGLPASSGEVSGVAVTAGVKEGRPMGASVMSQVADVAGAPEVA